MFVKSNGTMQSAGVHCTAPVQNGFRPTTGLPHPRGSYSPLPHIHLGNGLGPSWPSDLPHYTLLPEDFGVNAPPGGLHCQSALNGTAASAGVSSRGTSTAQDWTDPADDVPGRR